MKQDNIYKYVDNGFTELSKQEYIDKLIAANEELLVKLKVNMDRMVKILNGEE